MMWVQLRIWWRFLTPQHLVTHVLGFLAGHRLGPITRWGIRWFMRRYGVDLESAERTAVEDFPTFHEFFVRHLREDARPIQGGGGHWVSPVDGTLSAAGGLDSGTLLQAKGQTYSLAALLAGEDWGAPFLNGQYATIYLAPKNYHRIHMPCAGRLTAMRYVPGRLFSVDEFSVSHIPRIFARNERVISLFETKEGPLAMVAVGAMIVGSVTTVWHGPVQPKKPRLMDWSYGAGPCFQQGEEMGYFSLGSTVIILRASTDQAWPDGLLSREVQMGERFTGV